MPYDFLILALLTLVPGMVIFLLRRDLRRVIVVMGLCAIPFAFTERLFVGTYWEPTFLFGLGALLGFGLEDVLFVVGLAAFTATIFAVVSGKRYQPCAETRRGRVVWRVALLLGLTCLFVAGSWALRVPMIYSAFAIMALLSVALVVLRRDLLVPLLAGAALSGLVYTVVCLAVWLLIPDVFARIWRTEALLNLFVGPVPLEEVLYGALAGAIATVFYPWAFGQRFVSRGG